MTGKVGDAAVGERRKPGMGKLPIYLSYRRNWRVRYRDERRK